MPANLQDKRTHNQGRLSQWQDDKGFGFISPLPAGPRIFLHISALTDTGQRPKQGDLLEFVAVKDSDGRLKARRARLLPESAAIVPAPGPRKIKSKTPKVARRPGKAQPKGRLGRALWLVSIFALVLATLAWHKLIPIWLPGVYLLLSLLAYAVYAKDKSAALAGDWRISEGHLLLWALLGGWPGALIARHHLSHKSRKLSFRLAFVFCSTLNLLLLGQAIRGQWLTPFI
ncbi:cold shock and DUF1294 domain-containing protein [Shewanella cyperi]|uniref:cold shock and DUF1294 domain-containing protein n=1 Tax=Shewanella cyperi TaxID=2814292 RepID=UPI001A948D72|nr:cold shock and DUF1294 domain-containing protein [Shewanella cyperi]QSX40143.1 cold shock and DUF1294 domain-containing protein [Shewanella cyperi]